MALERLRAVLFDKDGTLFDFTASWAGWTHSLLNDLAASHAVPASRLAHALGFDLGSARFAQNSPVIAGTVDDCVDLLAPHLPAMPRAELLAHLLVTSAQAMMVPAVPLAPLLGHLRAQGLTLGIATNDSEKSARAHLDQAGITDHFAQILGYDSGYTPKPAPDMLLAFAAKTGTSPAHIAMVGDSLHDLIAGRAAGMQTIGVLTGPATADTLAPHADIILPDIGHLPDLIGAN